MNITCAGEKKLFIGQPLACGIWASVRDITTVERFLCEISDITVSGEGLVVDKCTKTGTPGGRILIGGVTFGKGPVGPKELYVSWRTFKECVTLELVAFPVSLSFPGFTSEKVVTILSGHTLTSPLIVQLVDENEKPCRESGFKIELIVSDGLEFEPSLEGALSNRDGQVNYGKPKVSTNSGILLDTCPLNLCKNDCLGIHTATAKASYKDQTIMGRMINIHIPINPNKPVAISVVHSDTGCYTAGSEFKEYKVSVIAEGNCVLESVLATQLSMKLWQKEKSKIAALAFLPTVDRSCKETGVFTFRKRLVPRTVGVYLLQFVYDDGAHIINSDIMEITVLPGRPVKLVPEEPLQLLNKKTVSNTDSVQSRILVEHLELEMKDAYDNIAGKTLYGQVTLTVTCDDANVELPLLTGGVPSVRFPIVKGRIILKDIMIDENCPGVDGQEYCLRCEVGVHHLPESKPMESFNIPFLFYHDLKKQELVSRLVTAKNELATAIRAYSELFETTRRLLIALEGDVKQLVVEEDASTLKLQKYGIYNDSVNTLENARALLKQKTSQRDSALNVLKCYTPPTVKDNLVVGKVWELAIIIDDNISRLISWHLADSMECTVTHTIKKAVEICGSGCDKQQVLALDYLHDKKEILNLWRESLPHMKIPGFFKCVGNPIFARDFLIFPKEFVVCKIVFGLLLGDTIVMNTLEDGVHYRKEVLKHGKCPTILTRDGRRIQSNGKFGGEENKASCSTNEQRRLFGDMLPIASRVRATVIELLEAHCLILERLAVAKQELAEHIEDSSGSTTAQRIKDFIHMKAQLQEVGLHLEENMVSRPKEAKSTNLKSPRKTQRNGATVSNSGARKSKRLKTWPKCLCMNHHEQGTDIS